jgi:hypothetical protein
MSANILMPCQQTFSCHVSKLSHAMSANFLVPCQQTFSCHVSKFSRAMSPTFSKPGEMELVQETMMIENTHCSK